MEVQTASGPWRASLEDLSASGACLSCPRSLGSWGDSVILCLHRSVGLDSRVEIPGTIVRASGGTFGLRFDAVEPATRTQLDTLINRLTRGA